MSEIICEQRQWTGEVIEEETCLSDWGLPLPEGQESACCVCNYFEIDPCENMDGLECGMWEVRFEDAPRVLHAWSNNDGLCPKVAVARVVECRCNGCCGGPDDRFEYCWPEGCPYTILPPGTYRIRIPKQNVYNLDAGTRAVVNVLLEPVGAMFVQAVMASSAGSDCCGSSPASSTCGCG